MPSMDHEYPDIVQSRRGAEVMLDVLRSEGVRYVFGNPGTTEMPLIDALTGAPDLRYILALQEASVVAMADGYAQASGKTGFANVHTAGGLGHAMGAMVNAQVAKTPLVVTAGQQDLRHTVADPLLSGNLVGIAAPCAKWAHEVTHPDHIPVLLHRAFNDSRAAPAGPVFLALPMDVMEGATAMPPGEPSRIEPAAVAGALEQLGDALAAVPPGRLAIIAGDEVFRARAVAETVALAETLAAPVFGSSWPGHLPFPTTHPQWAGTLPSKASEMRASLSRFTAVLALGGHSMISYLYTGGSPLPAQCRFFQLSADQRELGRTHVTALACLGEIKASLDALLPIIEPRLLPHEAALSALRSGMARACEAVRIETASRVAAGLGSAVITPFTAAAQVMLGAGPKTPIIDEAPVTTGFVSQFFTGPGPPRYFRMRGAVLGWGMPAAVGVSLGFDREPVVCMVGDGSAMYSPQALWTAAREQLPVTFVVLNNCSYDILKSYMKAQPQFLSAQANHFIGMDLDHPMVDFLALASSMGVSARRVKRPGDVAEAVRDGVASGRPNLVEVVLGN